MLFRIIGAVCVLATCGGVGFGMAYKYAQEERMLLQLLDVLEYMECEITYHLTPLPLLCRQASREGTGMIHTVFLSLANELERQVSPDVVSCMNVAVNSISRIPTQIARMFLELGRQLGRFDLQGQLKGIEIIKQKIRGVLKEKYKDKEEHMRRYKTFGICAGVSLIILLL